MVIGVVAGEQLYEQINKLNFRGEYDIRWVEPKEPTAICRTLEANQEFTDVLLDVASLKAANADESVNLADRLLRTTHLHIMVLADGYLPESRLIRDLVSVGVPRKDIFLQTGVKLQMRISNLLHTAQPSPPVEEETPMSAETPEQKEEVPAEEQPVSAAVVPPSQVDAAAGKSMQIRKPARPATRAVTIAVAGGGPRIGTTTQAMQLLLYLTAQNFRCAYVDMQQTDQMRQYLAVYEKCEQLGPHEFTIQGCHILDTGKLLMQARMEYDYLICDYGDYAQIIDTVSFWEKDIKVLVAGIKPWESDQLSRVFDDDDGSLHYIFSFVPKADEADVRNQMGESAPNTYFAPYAPDYFSYCGDDEFYAKIIACKKAEPQQRKKGFAFNLFHRRK